MASTNPAHRALTSLLPTSFQVPHKLLSAASTLLSLSQQRAANLKPDEEIARPHACAELACKRLRVQLRLPNIKSGNGAPCRPNVYKKLLAFLEKTLEDVDVLGTPRKKADEGVRTPTTGGKSTGRATSGRKRNIGALDVGEEDIEVETPTKKRRVNPDVLATPTKSTGKKTNGFVGRIDASTSRTKKGGIDPPVYVLPSIRKLCKAFKTPKMVPHVYTGVCVVLDLSGYWPLPTEADSPQEAARHQQALLGLTVAVYLMTLTRMQKGPMTTELYDALSMRSIELLEMAEEQIEAQASIEGWIARINDSGWTTEHGRGADWWSSVPEDVVAPPRLSTIETQIGDIDPVDVEGDNEETPRAMHALRKSKLNANDARRNELLKQLDEEDSDDVLLPGLGTMMNDAVDYLSDERTAEYEVWKADVLRRIDAMEKGGGSVKKRKGKAVAAAA